MISLKKQFIVSLGVLVLLLAIGTAFVGYFFRILNSPNIYFLDGRPGRIARQCAIKNNDFDALILGSSMSTNFLCSDFDRCFDTNTLKLAYNGAQLPDVMEIAALALKEKKNTLRFILIDLTSVHFREPHEKNLLNDDSIKGRFDILQDYVSFDTIRYAIAFAFGEGCTPVHRDDYACWYKESKYKFPIKQFAMEAQKHPGPNSSAYYFSDENTQKAIKLFEHDVLPIVNHYPETTFIFFFPPYSFLAYEHTDHKAFIEYKRIVINMLCNIPNVRFYDFQNVYDVASVLENYRDYRHYMQHINAWMIEQMAQDRYRVTSRNAVSCLEEFQKTLSVYDYAKDRARLNAIYEEQR